MDGVILSWINLVLFFWFVSFRFLSFLSLIWFNRINLKHFSIIFILIGFTKWNFRNFPLQVMSCRSNGPLIKSFSIKWRIIGNCAFKHFLFPATLMYFPSILASNLPLSKLNRLNYFCRNRSSFLNRLDFWIVRILR